MTAELRYRTARTDETTIIVGRGLAAEGSLPAPFERAVFVVDERVASLWAESLGRLASALAHQSWMMRLEAGETAKTPEGAARLIAELSAIGIAKDDWLVGVGGGTITDLTSFVAQIFLRGTKCALVPTTLLAQIDAAIGGKSGLNLDGGKNRIGSFYHPAWVFCDTLFLDTLPERQLRSGVAEALKVFAVSDGDSFNGIARDTRVLTESVRRDDLVDSAVRAKAILLEQDPYESCPRRLLNFGHTFAHSFEEESRFTLTHGEAVLLSMLCETRIGLLLGVCAEEVFEDLYYAVDLYLSAEARRFRASTDQICKALRHTRSLRAGRDDMITLSAIGRGTLVSLVPPDVAVAAWDEVSALFHRDES
jgi:3-dehydroquinate synthase